MLTHTSLRALLLTVIRARAQNGLLKHFFLTWTGPSLSAIKRGKVAMTKGGE